MSDVQFDEERQFNQFATAAIIKRSSEAGGIIGLLIKMGIAKNVHDAKLVLGTIALLAIIGTFFTIKKGIAAPEMNYAVEIPPEVLRELPQQFRASNQR